MTLTAKVQEDLITAMRGKNALAKGVLQIVKSNLTAKLKEKQLKDPTAELTETEELAVIQKEVKQTEDAFNEAKKANRQDMVDKELLRLEVLNAYLPKQLDEVGIVEVLKTLPITKETNMGEAMQVAKSAIGAQAPGKLISTVVKQYLQTLL